MNDTCSKHEWIMKSFCSVKEANYKNPHIVWFHLYEMSRTGKSVWDRKYIGGNLWLRGWREMESDSQRIQDFFRRLWKCPKIDYGHSCTTLSILKNTELYNLSKWIVWYVNYISVNLFFLKNSINPHFLILGGLGRCFLTSCAFHPFTLSVFLSHSSVWFMPLIPGLLSLCFSVSPPSLIPPLLHFSLPKNSRKFSEALLLQVCSCRESISHQAGGFPVSQPASQFSPCHNYEWPQYTLHITWIMSSKEKQRRGPSPGSFLCQIEPLATLIPWEVEQFRKQAFLKSLGQLPQPLKGTKESKAKHDRGDTWKKKKTGRLSSPSVKIAFSKNGFGDNSDPAGLSKFLANLLIEDRV